MLERAILIGLITPKIKKETVLDFLKELSFLAKTAGAKPIKTYTQKLPHPDSATFLGKGKMNEIQQFASRENIDLIIFDDDLTNTQLRNIELFFKCKILDRSSLILDIFAARAQTASAKTQVQLAQYEYLLPRLTRMWTHLERQKGGIGMRGPGETQIETDRRIIKDKIALLKKKLVKIDKQSLTRRKGREQLIRVALVGYTNAGKSTLMNQLSKSNILAENKLFATLDTTVRKVVIENLPFLLSDTVGFIRKLPHQLIESFKSTLDEVRESDLLLHIIDISNKNFEDQIKIVNKTIKELGAEQKPCLLIFNKIDMYLSQENFRNSNSHKLNSSLKELKNTWMSKSNKNTLFISATNKTNFNNLRSILYKTIKELHIQRYPYNNFLY
ncbi:MAG: GTPase HflX [Bacteroidota bacterium]|nr:GTPase HflX [Bacteroidota bacterium]